MRITILGSGTSTGVPVPGCGCAVCNSADPKNQRLRTSVAIEIPRPGGPAATILIDTATDLRTQVLRAGLKRVDAVLYTHTHADHIFGIDDLRCFNFAMNSSIPLYASAFHAAELRRIFSYIFSPPSSYPGGALPKLELNEIEPLAPFEAAGESIRPLPLKHGDGDVLGFRLRNFAYLTDCSLIPPASRNELHGLDLLIIDGLRIRPHRTHFNFEQAIAEIEALRPRRTLLIHMSHEIGHDEGNELIAGLTSLPVELSYDGQVIQL